MRNTRDDLNEQLLVVRCQAGDQLAFEEIVRLYGDRLRYDAAIEGLIFALLATIVLLVLQRRATLRQINVNLIRISQQLRELSSR